MPTKKTSTVRASSKSADSSSATSTHSTPASSPAPVKEAGASTTTDPKAGTTTSFLQPPPATANIPPVPVSFIADNGVSYRGTAPKKAELVALPLAVKDLLAFTNYNQVIGTTAPSYEALLEMFQVTSQWSTMRTASAAWDGYAEVQEGICWRAMRTALARLKPAFQLVVTGDPQLASTFAGLSTLLGVKKEIARKALATKRANKKAVAEGKAPTHGAVGKARKKSADKAIVQSIEGAAAAQTSTSSAPAAGAAQAVAAPVVAAPITNSASTAAATPAVNGVNTAAH